MLRDTPDAQVRVSQAESLVRSARLFLFDSVDRLWQVLLATGEVTMEARAHAADRHQGISGLRRRNRRAAGAV